MNHEKCLAFGVVTYASRMSMKAQDWIPANPSQTHRRDYWWNMKIVCCFNQQHLRALLFFLFCIFFYLFEGGFFHHWDLFFRYIFNFWGTCEKSPGYLKIKVLTWRYLSGKLSKVYLTSFDGISQINVLGNTGILLLFLCPYRKLGEVCKCLSRFGYRYKSKSLEIKKEKSYNIFYSELESFLCYSSGISLKKKILTDLKKFFLVRGSRKVKVQYKCFK